MFRDFLQGIIVGLLGAFFAGLGLWRHFRRPTQQSSSDELLQRLLAEHSF